MEIQPQGQPVLGTLPTTIEAALQPSTESRVITEPVEPFRIVHVNDVWCHVCGFDSEEVLGQTCRVLQGPGSCKATLTMLKQALLYKRNFAVQLLNYTKQGRPFMNTLQVTPLVDRDGKVTHYLGVVIARYLDGAGYVSPSIQRTSESSHALALSQREADPARRGGSSSCSSIGSSNMTVGVGGSSGALGGSDPMGFGQMHQSGGMIVPIDPMADDGATGRVPPFLTKLCEILTVESSEIILFSPDTSSFTIKNPTTFAKEVRCGRSPPRPDDAFAPAPAAEPAVWPAAVRGLGEEVRGTRRGGGVRRGGRRPDPQARPVASPLSE